QEQWIDKFGNPRCPSNWRPIYPTPHYKDPRKDRSIIFINNAIKTDTYEQIEFPSSDVTVVRFKGPFGQLTLFNIYNDCSHSNTVTTLDAFMRNE
ncbi:hypothetical protein OF83DRAFT_1031594, partial [Amylostereum chailletii]